MILEQENLNSFRLDPSRKEGLNMDLPQWPLPLPKIYRPALVIRISWLFIGILVVPVVLAGIGAISIGLVTGRLLQSFPLWFAYIYVGIIIISPFILLVLCMHILNFFRLCLKLTQEGIFFFTIGQRFFTPWSNIASFRSQNNLRLVEMHQAAEEISVENGVHRNVAAHEVAWWLGWGVNHPAPFFGLPEEFGEVLRDGGEIEWYFRKYAPQAFHR